MVRPMGQTHFAEDESVSERTMGVEERRGRRKSGKAWQKNARRGKRVDVLRGEWGIARGRVKLRARERERETLGETPVSK